MLRSLNCRFESQHLNYFYLANALSSVRSHWHVYFECRTCPAANPLIGLAAFGFQAFDCPTQDISSLHRDRGKLKIFLAQISPAAA